MTQQNQSQASKQAQQAMQQLDGTDLDGRMLRLLLAPARGPAKLMSAGFGLVTNAITKIIGAQVLQDMKAFVAQGEGRGAPEPQDIPEELQAQAQEYREKLMDEVAENSDELMERYLEGEEIDHDEIVTVLKRGVTDGKIFPVTCGVATKNLGATRLLEAERPPAPRLSAITSATVEAAGRTQAWAVGPQRAAGEDHAVLGAVRQDQPFVRAKKQHVMIARHRAAAHSRGAGYPRLVGGIVPLLFSGNSVDGVDVRVAASDVNDAVGDGGGVRPAATVAKARLVETCGKCHAGATERFVQYDPHPDPRNFARSAVLWWANRFYWVLIPSFLGFFGLHSLLWFWRSRKDEHAHKDGTR